MDTISRLEQVIQQLYSDAEKIDACSLSRKHRLFDRTLFQCGASYLKPCVAEAQQTLKALVAENRSRALSTERAEFLTEKLLNQISALRLEMDSNQHELKEPKASYQSEQHLTGLKKQLNKHLEWETRLKEKIREKEFALRYASTSQQKSLQAEILVTEQRLARCLASKRNIEQSIGKLK